MDDNDEANEMFPDETDCARFGHEWVLTSRLRCVCALCGVGVID